MQDFIELRIISAVKELLSGKVNELLGDMQFFIPLVEFSGYKGYDVVVPEVKLSSCERTEKDRLIFLDAYTVSITFSVPDSDDSEFLCYAYGSAVCNALELNPTLGGVANRVIVSGKKYVEPKIANCGEKWQLIVTLQIKVEGTVYVS